MRFFKLLALVVSILTATSVGAFLRVREELAAPKSLMEAMVRPVPSEQPTGDGELSADAVPEESGLVAPIPGAVTLLLVGLDDLGGVSRSDSIALAVFSEEKRSVRILSIPRDSRVQIPGHGWQKINHAYAYGGVELLKKTVENFLEMEINRFVILGFQSFPRIIDLIGGIDIDVEKKLVYRDRSQKLYINIPKGPQHMDGKTALEYVRFRHDPLGDIGRVRRQQKFVSIAMDKLKSPSILPKIPSLLDEALAAINSDLTPMEALRLLHFANALPPERIQLHMAPGRDALIDKLSYWLVDISAAVAWLASDVEASAPVPAAPLPSPEETRGLVAQIGRVGILNGDGGNGLVKKASQLFQKVGIAVGETGNASHFAHSATNIVYPENAEAHVRQAAEALGALCGITDPSLVKSTPAISAVALIVGHDKETLFKRLESLPTP